MSEKKKPTKQAEIEAEVLETEMESIEPSVEELAEDSLNVAPPENWRDVARMNGATEKDIKNMERFFFYARPMIKDGSKETKKAMAGEVIITDDDEIETTSDAYREDVLNLNASAQTTKRILKGRITGCKSAGDSRISTNLATVAFGNGTCSVVIPDYCLFHFNIPESGVRTPELQRLLADNIIQRIGSEIFFKVKQFDQNTNTAYADRLKAMELTAFDNYIRRLNNTNKPRVIVGSIVRGIITAVRNKSITVYALGSESVIYQDKRHGSEVSWYHIDDLRTRYKVGDAVPCKVLSIEINKVKKYDEEYVIVQTQLSVKQVTADPQVKYYNDYKIGQVCECEITEVNETSIGVYGILTNGNSQVNCLVSYPNYGSIPEVGDRRIIRITEKAEKTRSGSLLEKDGRLVRRIFGVFVDA